MKLLIKSLVYNYVKVLYVNNIPFLKSDLIKKDYGAPFTDKQDIYSISAL